MGTTKKILFTLLALAFAVGCSTRKNGWLNRNYHAMGTYYNILYNGNLALEQGKQTLVQDYFDDYWEILPVERMAVKTETEAPASTVSPPVGPGAPPKMSFGKSASMSDVQASTASSNSPSADDFALAEEKATKAIQKHSMLIDGTEYNPQIDEAFLLLGKARYFDQRYVPALDAFNYILNNFPDKTTLIPARIWKAKTQLRMDYTGLAMENLQEILKEHATDSTASFKEILWQLDKKKDIEDEYLAAISATMAQAYINLDEKEKAIVPISIAAKKTENEEERGRYLYIKGQLYDAIGQTDSANAAFDEIIALKRKTLRDYRIHAFMEKAKNHDLETEGQLALLEMLNELAENRENRPYLDNIYYQLAEYFRKTDSLEAAIVYYNKSLREDSPDKYLNSRSYLVLGNINFDRAEYKEAGAYYDSTLAMLSEATREFRKLKKKRDNLDDVILYEDIATVNDSILNLVAMSGPEQLAYFSKYAEKIKAEQIEQEIAAFEAAKATKQNTGAGNFKQKTGFGAAAGGGNNAGTFYFYDPTQVAYGKLAFTQTWGDRALQDNWRTDDSGGGGGDSGEKEEKLTEEAIIAKIEANPKFDPQTYIAKIPTDQTVIDSLKKDRDFAYYQLGVIYKEKFKEYELAANKLEALLKNDPEERLVLPAKYNLYKIYLETGQTGMANRWKQDILTKHPDSRYAQIIRNPREYRAGEDTPEAVYAGVYRKYLDGQYELVIQKSDEYITKFTGDPIVPKFELLKAVAIGRYKGFEEYKKALNFVALNYPLSEEGKKAQELYDNAIPTLAFQKFKENDPKDTYNLIYVFPKDSLKTAQKLRDTLSHAVDSIHYEDLAVSIDTYNENKIFVTVHDLDSQMGAKGFGLILREEKDYQIKKDFFVVSSSNYETILIHKNLNDYLVFSGNVPETGNIPKPGDLPKAEKPKAEKSKEKIPEKEKTSRKPKNRRPGFKQGKPPKPPERKKESEE